jgi:hypothetical protein
MVHGEFVPVNAADFTFMATSIVKFFKRSLGAALALAAVQSASAFSVFGPAETWQTTTLDYLSRYYYPAPDEGSGDIELGGTKNFGEGSRLNTPIITYGYDISFLTFFGQKGVNAVDSAMAVLNALPAASAANLSQFLMQGNQPINYTAQALQVTDLKSLVLSLMLEHMGLIGETHVWDLHARIPLPGTTVACQFAYGVINRNFDPSNPSYLPSSYVNGINYTYQIWDGCPVGVQVADAIEFPVDGASAAELTYSAVATRYGLEPGGYYLGLTYDDMGGLKYLYSKDNFAQESLDPTAAVSSFAGSSWEGVTDTNSTGATGITSSTTVSNFSGFLGGVEKITYVKLPTDSILGTGFTPRVFNYSIPWLTNGGINMVHITRTVVTPDIVFSAGDLFGNTTTFPFTYVPYARNFTYIASPAVGVGTDEVLPAVVSPQETITFNTVTPFTINETPSFLDGESVLAFPIIQFGSFDGTTNAPILYPNGTGVSQLIAALFNGSTTGGQASTWYGLTQATNTTATGGGGGGAAP